MKRNLTDITPSKESSSTQPIPGNFTPQFGPRSRPASPFLTSLRPTVLAPLHNKVQALECVHLSEKPRATTGVTAGPSAANVTDQHESMEIEEQELLTFRGGGTCPYENPEKYFWDQINTLLNESYEAYNWYKGKHVHIANDWRKICLYNYVLNYPKNCMKNCWLWLQKACSSEENVETVLKEKMNEFVNELDTDLKKRLQCSVDCPHRLACKEFLMLLRYSVQGCKAC